MYPQRAATTSTPSSQDVITVDVIRDGEGFEQLLGTWDSLLESSRSRVPFLKAAWIDCWRRYALRAGSLHVLAVRERGQLIGIAPLMRARRAMTLTDRLEFLATGAAGSDYLDLIVTETARERAIDAIAASIDAQQLPLYLDNLPPASHALTLAADLSRAGWTSLQAYPDVCPFIPLASLTWDGYLDTLGAAHRANVRRRIRSINAAFPVEFCLVDSQHERRTALDALVRFSEHRWRTRGGTSAFPEPAMIAFHHSVTRRAMAEGWLRLYTLSLNKHIVGVMYGFAVDGRFYFYQHGYDEAYARYSPGLVLMALTIQAAIADGMREFDMLYGHESYKSLWAREERRLERLQLFPPRITGRMLRRGAETRRALRLMAHQLGLKASHDHS